MEPLRGLLKTVVMGYIWIVELTGAVELGAALGEYCFNWTSGVTTVGVGRIGIVLCLW